MRRIMMCLLALIFCLAGVNPAAAHTPLCSCYLNSDGTVTCEGGFSDGSSATGVSMTVKAADGSVLTSGKIDENGEFSFEKPKVPFVVEFNAGPGHEVTVKGEDIK